MNSEFSPLSIALAAKRVRDLLDELDVKIQAAQILLSDGEPVTPIAAGMIRRWLNDMRETKRQLKQLLDQPMP